MKLVEVKRPNCELELAGYEVLGVHDWIITVYAAVNSDREQLYEHGVSSAGEEKWWKLVND